LSIRHPILDIFLDPLCPMVGIQHELAMTQLTLNALDYVSQNGPVSNRYQCFR